MSAFVRAACFIALVPLYLPAQRMAPTYADLQAFLDSCPQNDPYISIIQRDFQITRNGAAASAVTCTEPYSQMPVLQITEELSTLQTLRFAYYMDMGQSNYLPWTPFRLYDWLKSRVAGLNIDSSLVGASAACCSLVNSRLVFIVGLISNDLNRQYRQLPDGQAAQLQLFAHEARHSEGTDFPHVSSCGIQFGCDQTYDENDLSPYGIQYYLSKQMLSGAINLGYSCDASTRAALGAKFAQLANVFPQRFVTNPPPPLAVPQNPGGLCIPASTFSVSGAPVDALSSSSGTFSISVTASNVTAGWTADSPSTWIAPVSGFNSLGSGQATFAFTQNPTNTTRTGTVIVAGQTFSVTQAACASNCASQVTITAVVSGAPLVSNITSGSWVTIFGTNLSSTSRPWAAADFVGNKLPLSLDGVSVRIDGLPAAVYYVSPTQINVQCPDDGAVGPLQVVVEVTNSLGSATANATFASSAPAFFTIGQVPTGHTVTGQYAAAVHLDGTYVAPAGFYGPGVTSTPAAPDETIVLYATGCGATDPPTGSGVILKAPAPMAFAPTLKIGGQATTIGYAGLVAPGLYQFNVVVPQVADGDQPLAGAGLTVYLPVKR